VKSASPKKTACGIVGIGGSGNNSCKISIVAQPSLE
jgi:hypothetical protein